VQLAVDAAAEDLQIEENFVCEFGALFRHRFLFLRTGRLIDFCSIVAVVVVVVVDRISLPSPWSFSLEYLLLSTLSLSKRKRI
jgi:hypothetical protein